ncbi:GMP/IMP nucleotidase [Catenovulum sp. SM1970]|uniref:GMP/IMP nucleotidase n=1 Tax=Marinifaba aquimaris TaxID=2741323 RepID=UPI0015726785|nr:GMP/IMP nucleotidase [Marinifaba aquimaris]NTS76540.1 GMP/IMP nucleotidase [Marinifaba aquimaris]
MLQWKDIDTVLLDMDGTLLDLHFDNHFWLEFVPQRFAELQGISKEAALEALKPKFAEQAGHLNWYCLDYWQKELDLDLVEMKKEICHLIDMREDVPAFLTALKKAGKRIILVTNAHPDSLTLKIEHTELDKYIDELVSTHTFGVSKESKLLWQQLEEELKFDCHRSLFIDDSIPILTTAREFGIRHLVAVANPDSKQETREITQFDSITSYNAYTNELNQLYL